MRNLANGDLHLLGTFYKAGTKQLLPTNPWRSGSTPGSGNIPVFSAGQTLEIRDTDANNAYKLRWREVNIGGKKLLISDRNILEQVSWDDLNAQSLIFGKTITIDGQQYKLRLLTGGSNYRNTSDAYAGGTPTNNEWDQIIANEGGYPGLPTPSSSDLDSSLNDTDKNSAHNQFWNWYYMYSWAQETYTGGSSYRAIRGYGSARYWGGNGQSNRTVDVGWRPVLEVLNSSPLISGDTQNQGNKTAPFSVNYQVSDPENDAVNVVVKLNSQVIDTKNNISQGVNHTVAITTEQWAALPLNQQSTITIEATDSKNAKSTRVYTFTKTNAAPTAIAVEPKGNLANLAIVDTITPVFVHQFSDTDPGDVQSAYQYIVEDLNENIVHDTGKVISTQTFFQVPEGKLNWGTRYKYKLRVWDKFDVPSEYTAYEFLLPNRAPNITDVQPGTNDAENPMGAGTAPEFTWTFEDLDSEAQMAYQLKIFNTSDVLIYDSSKVYKNVNKHQVPQGALTDGMVYYALLTVWDPNNLSKTSEKAYFRTNATPSAPILTGPIDNYRTALKPTFSAIIGTDPEDDGQHFAIQISDDVNFEKNVLTFRSDKNRTGWKVNYYDIPEEGVFNSQQGQPVTYEMQVGLNMNQTYYWRMAAVDAKTGAVGTYSISRKIRAGNRLEFTLANPINTEAVAARRILFAADYTLPLDGTNRATIKIEFSNNAFDVTPTWEDATAEFLSMDYYNFTNTEKTAERFAIGVRVTINANDSLLPISVDAIGLTFD